MQVTINGALADLADGETVETVVAARTAGHDRVAVAVNGDVVPRSGWASTQLAAGDRLEILAPTAGG